jgi:hypothetical protein
LVPNADSNPFFFISYQLTVVTVLCRGWGSSGSFPALVMAMKQ